MRQNVFFAALTALAVAGCHDKSEALVSAIGDAAIGKALAAPAATELWKERGPNDPLPPGVVPMPSLAPLVRALKPGVVNIYTTQRVSGRAARHGLPPGMQDPFEEFWRNFHGQPQREESRQNLGSGFLINAGGYVITNNHVVEGATEIKVKLADAREFDAEIVGRDPKTDVALIKVKGDAKDLPTVPLGNSDALEVGDFVVAMGNPFGLDHSVSQGIVSAKERVIGAGPYDDFIQTDAAINPGNSGGPLFNTRGEVIGVNTAIVAHGQGIGFAVPINMVKELLPQLLEKGRAVRGWLGVSIQDLTPELARVLKLQKAQGALIAGILPQSPAASAGLKAGDVVVGVNGRKVDSYNQLSRYVAFIPPGGTASLTVYREGKEQTFNVKVSERPDEEEDGANAPPARNTPTSDKLGLSVAPLAAARAQRLGVDGGVQIEAVHPDGPAARAGARPGDVIVEVQRQPVRSVQEYVAA
ncbi:MAG: DegQ family serine endoprotease, partial [Myxococcales bacterium]